MTLKQQRILHFSVERGMRNMNYKRNFSYIMEAHQRTKWQSLPVTGCRIQRSEVADVISTFECACPIGKTYDTKDSFNGNQNVHSINSLSIT